MLDLIAGVDRADSHAVADEIHNIHGSIPRPPRVSPVHRDPPKRDRREDERPPHHEGDTVDLSDRDEGAGEAAAEPTDKNGRDEDGEGGDHPHIDVSV